MKRILGYCTVISANSGLKTLLVSQQITLDEQKNVVKAKKVFTIDSINGDELCRTDDPNIFINRNGTRYKRTGPFQQGEPS